MGTNSQYQLTVEPTVSSATLYRAVLQRAAVNITPVSDVPPIVHEVLNSPGQPLDADMRAFMEPRFGYDFTDVPAHALEMHASPTQLQVEPVNDVYEHQAEEQAQCVTSSSNRNSNNQAGAIDFSKVRVHTDSKAAESAHAMDARAFTLGNHVVFGTGQYAPRTGAGQRLIAHELTHVVQQSGQASAQNIIQRAPEPQRELSWYEQTKEKAYTSLINDMRKQRDFAMNLLRQQVPRLPSNMRSAANTLIDVYGFCVDLLIGLDLAIIGLVVGFVEGIVGLIVSLVKLLYYVIKVLVDLILGVFDNFETFKNDIDTIVNGIKMIPQGLKIIIDNWWERYKKASPEQQALMGGELVGQVEAFIVTFAFAGAKAGQVPKLVVPTALKFEAQALTTGERVLVPVVTTTAVNAAAPVAAGALTAPALMQAAGTGSGGGEKEPPKEGPYKDIKDNTKVDPGRDFTQTQKKNILESNRARNGGRLKSDDPLDPYQDLSEPEKSVSPGMGGQPQSPAMAAVDHIVPKAAGGTNSYGNARVISQYWNNVLRAKGLAK